MANDDVQAKIAVLRRAVRQLSVLVEISVTLNQSLDLDTVLSLIVRHAKSLLQCESASILLYDEARDVLFFAKSSSVHHEKLQGRVVPIEKSVAGKVFLTRQAIISHSADEDPRHYKKISQNIHEPVNTLLAVPLLIEDTPLGVLEAVNKKEGFFDEDDGGLLSVLASQAAVAINNARLMAEVQAAYHNAREAERLKTNFLALSSHELRTPLGLIIGYASLLQEEFAGEVGSYAAEILKASMQMRKILEDMSSLTLLQQASERLHLDAVNVHDAFRRALSGLEPDLKQHGHRLKESFGVSGLLVKADPDWLPRALKNILHNAIRFTPDGGVINIGAMPRGDMALLWVKDNGIGLAPQHLSKIFQEFYQVEDHMTRSYGGLGIGLSIARNLIEAQGGKIWAESAGPGKGTRINITLPLAQRKMSPFV